LLGLVGANQLVLIEVRRQPRHLEKPVLVAVGRDRDGVGYREAFTANCDGVGQLLLERRGPLEFGCVAWRRSYGRCPQRRVAPATLG
jgi:hypothetical protein